MSVSLVLFALASFVFGWNNSSLVKGALVGPGLFAYRKATIITAAGLLAGAILEGGKMNRSLVGNLVPSVAQEGILATSIVTFLLLIVFTSLRLPVSLSNCLVGAVVGATVGLSTTFSQSYLLLIMFSWAIIPVLSALVSAVSYKIIRSIVLEIDLLGADVVTRLLLLIAVTYSAYSLGANNMGALISIFDAGNAQGVWILITSAAGFLLLGRSVTFRFSEDIVQVGGVRMMAAFLGSSILVWLFTQAAIPVSLSQAIVGGIVGVGLSTRPSIVNSKLVFEILGSWAIVTVLGFLLAYLVTPLLA